MAKKIFDLGDSKLLLLAQDPNFVREFPFLSKLRQIPARRCCGGQNNAQTAEARRAALVEVKTKLASLPPDRIQALAKFFNTESVRIRTKDASGHTVDKTLKAPKG